MQKLEDIKTVLGIAIVFVVVTSMFSLLDKLCLYIVRNDDNVVLKAFLYSNAFWFIVVIGVMVTLFIYAQKYGLKISINILNNRIICLSSGVLILINALFNFANTIITRIYSINSAFHTSQQLVHTSQDMLRQIVISNSIAILITFCQLIMGVCLMKIKRWHSN